MVYRLMKRLIETAIHDGTLAEKRESYIEKLNAFLMNDQITIEQYNELMGMMTPEGTGD